MIDTNFDDYDEESKGELKKLKFLSFGDFDLKNQLQLDKGDFLNFDDIQKSSENNQKSFYELNNIAINPTSSNNKFPQFPIGFNFTNLSTKDIGNKYYGNNAKYERSDVTVYTDDDIILKGGTLDEVKVYGDKYIKQFKGLRFVLFATRNGALLLQQHKECVPASDEIMWTPRTRSVLASAITLTNPSVSRLVLARLLPAKGNLPTLISPCSLACSSVRPTPAISGWV